MKTKFIFFIFLILSKIIFSQNPVTFETQVNKIGDNNFELLTKATIKEGWRLYSQNLPEGGAIPTEFVFEDSSNFDLVGNTKESESITKFDPIFNMEQTYFETQSIFNQELILKKNK